MRYEAVLKGVFKGHTWFSAVQHFPHIGSFPDGLKFKSCCFFFRSGSSVLPTTKSILLTILCKKGRRMSSVNTTETPVAACNKAEKERNPKHQREHSEFYIPEIEWFLLMRNMEHNFPLSMVKLDKIHCVITQSECIYHANSKHHLNEFSLLFMQCIFSTQVS